MSAEFLRGAAPLGRRRRRTSHAAQHRFNEYTCVHFWGLGDMAGPDAATALLSSQACILVKDVGRRHG